MGQRADNFLYAFNGTSLSWERMFGGGFAESPKHWVSVFRACSLEELLRIAREGVAVPPPDARHPDLRAEMEVLDKFRPSHIKKQGISRLGAIYATPTPQMPRVHYRKEHIIVEMKVDPADCYVGDMDFITSIIPFIEVHRYGLAKFRGAFSKYWDGVVPLADFFANYSPIETPEGTHWMLRSRGKRNLPQSFFVPEVLVMTPRISPRFVRMLRKDESLEDVTALMREPLASVHDEDHE